MMFRFQRKLAMEDEELLSISLDEVMSKKIGIQDKTDIVNFIMACFEDRILNCIMIVLSYFNKSLLCHLAIFKKMFLEPQTTIYK